MARIAPDGDDGIATDGGGTPSGNPSDPPASDPSGDSPEESPQGPPNDAPQNPSNDAPQDPPNVDTLLDELEELEETVISPDAREQVRQTMRVARRLDEGGTFGRVIRGFDRADAAEVLVGSVVFGIPMALEEGTLEAGAYIATHPLLLGATIALGIAIVSGLLYATDIQRVQIVNPIFGLVPRRLAAVVTISALTAVVMMTGWGRVDWAQPWLAASQTSVCFVGMALGAALGDILPGT